MPGIVSSGSVGSAQGRRLTLWGVAFFFCVMIALSALLVWSEATRKVDRLLHDSWVRYDQRPSPSDVVIAAIDTPSLNAFGRWPWSRALQARLIDELAEQGVQLAVMDLLYTEPDSNPQEDQLLATAIARLPVSVLPVLIESNGGKGMTELLPIPVITREVTDLGHVSLPIDDDGIVRRTFLKAGFTQAHWSALSVAALSRLNQAPYPLPGREASDVPQIRQWVRAHEVLVPFYGPAGAFERVSAVDIIRGDLSGDSLKGKIVFVGLTTTGLGDVVPTPVSAQNRPMPGVEIHANVFSALRDGIMVTELNAYFSVLLCAVLLPLIFLVYSRISPEWSLPTAVIAAALPILISMLIYRYARYWYPPLSASMPLLISYLYWSRHRLRYVNRFLEQERTRMREQGLPQAQDFRAALADFFTSAQRHLPVDGWRIQWNNGLYVGDTTLPEISSTVPGDQWLAQDNVYARRYAEPDQTLLQLRITSPEHAGDITSYVHTLMLRNSADNKARFSDSIERLQSNVQNLSGQLDWLRSIKVFADTMLDASPAGFGLWNPAGECIRANALLYQLVPDFRTNGQLIDLLDALERPSDRADALSERSDALYRLIWQGQPWQIVHRRDESEQVVNFRAVGGTLAERLICVSVVDVSEMRSAEKARAEMVDYLSHDLRSPLVSALYQLESAGDHPEIARNIQGSLSMMDSLLHIARVDELSVSSFEPLLLDGPLDNAISQLLPQADKRHIRLTADITDDEHWVMGDSAALERAIANLVGNAIKYSPEHTAVHVTLLCENHQVVVTVDDEGPGINPMRFRQLLQRFRRDVNASRSRDGLGLGLALVARVVQRHNGTVEAQRREVGTRISVRLPLEPVSE